MSELKKPNDNKTVDKSKTVKNVSRMGYGSADPTKYVYFKRVPKVIYEDPDDKSSKVLAIKYEMVVDYEVDIQEYINSFADSVGPKAIVQRMQDGVDVSQFLNSKPGIQGAEGEVVDASPYLGDGGDAYDRLKQASDTFDQLDPALRGNARDINEFMNGLKKETIDKYIQDRVNALMPQSGGDK